MVMNGTGHHGPLSKLLNIKKPASDLEHHLPSGHTLDDLAMVLPVSLGGVTVVTAWSRGVCGRTHVSGIFTEGSTFWSLWKQLA